MAIKKTGSGKSSRKGLFSWFRKTTFPEAFFYFAESHSLKFFPIAASLILILSLTGSSSRAINISIPDDTQITLSKTFDEEITNVSEVEVLLKDKAGKNLAGTVTIIGDTTINDNAFLSPKSYILKNMTGIEDILNGKRIFVSGNPTREGYTRLIIEDPQDLRGTIIASNMLGQEMDRTILPNELNIYFRTKPGIVLVTYLNGSVRMTFKIVNNSNIFNMDIVQEKIVKVSTALTSLKPGIKSNKGAMSDDYSFSFTDPSSNVENYTEMITVTPGSKVIIDSTLEWTAKNVKYSLTTNTNSKIRAIKADDGTVLDEATTASGVLPVQTFVERFDKDAGLSLIYEISGAFTDTAKFTRTQFRDEEFVADTIRNGRYYVTITGNGENFVVKKAGVTLASADVGHESYFKFQADQTMVDIEVSGDGLMSKIIPTTLNKGAFSQNVTLESAAYSHSARVDLASSNAMKTIKDGTRVYMVKAPAFQDTAWTVSNNRYVEFDWNDNNSSASIKVGAEPDGHASAEVPMNVGASATAILNFLANSYSLTQPLHINNQTDEDVANVRIAGGDAPVFTNATGDATLIRSNLTTDGNNIPFANYSTSITLTGPIETLNAVIQSIAGTNPVSTHSVNQIYEHVANGSALSSKAGKTIKDNTQVYFSKFAGDTTWVSTLNGAFTHTWSDLNKTTNVDVGATPDGHAHNKTPAVVGASANVSITFPAINYSFSQPVHVNNQTAENVANVKIEGGDTPVFTNTTGDATYTKSNLETDANNLPLANYETSVTLTAPNIQSLSTIIESIAGTNPQVSKAVNQTYNHLINGIVHSSLAGKEIKDNSQVYISKAPGDTTWVSTLDEGFTYSWTDLNKTKVVTFGSDAESVVGHGSAVNTATIDDSENVSITLPALTYSFVHPVLVKDQYDAIVPAAQVSGGDAPVNTGADGKANVSKSNLATDVNNLPFANYVTSITLTKTDYDNLNTSLTSIVGINSEQLINMNKQVAANVIDLDIVLKDVNGDKVYDLTQKVEFDGDGSFIYVTPDANGVIHINKTETGTPSTKLKISNTSQKYCQDFMVFRKENQPLTEQLNIAQIARFDGVPEVVDVPLAGLPSRIIEYVVKAKDETPAPVVYLYGDSIPMTHPVPRQMMGGRNGARTSKFASFESSPTIDVVQALFDWDTKVPIDEANNNRVRDCIARVLPIYTLNDGTKLMDYVSYQISSLTDPRWLAIGARGANNFARVHYRATTPNNGVILTTENSQNGASIFDWTVAEGSTGVTTGIWQTEIYQQFTNNADPVQGSGAWVTSTSGEVTKFGKTLARIIYLLNQGTPTN